MTMSKHTPGPWAVREGDDGLLAGPENGFSIIGGCGCCGSPYVNGDGDEVRANGRLIAAAPDLLEALQMLIGDGGLGLGRTLSKRLNAAHAAVAKATGEAE